MFAMSPWTLVPYLAVLFATTISNGDVTSDFKTLVTEYWDWRLEQSPEFATAIGINKYNDRLTSYSMDVYPQRKTKADSILSRLKALDSKSLSKADQMNYILLLDGLTTYTEGYKWFDYGALNPVNFLEGLQTDPSRFFVSIPLKTKEDFDNYLARLALIDTTLYEHIVLFRRAIAMNRTLHEVSVNRVPGQIEKILTDDPIHFSLYQPFNETLENTTISETDKAVLRGNAVTTLTNKVLGPYGIFKTFLETEYIPATRSGFGVDSWDNGKQYYEACLKWHLSVQTTADEIHALGLKEVERISTQMRKIIRGEGFEGTIPEYFQMLKQDDKFKLPTAEAILQEYADIAFKRIDPKLENYFKNIPDLPLVIKEMPYDGPGGAYSSGSADGSRPGTFWVNVIRPEATNTFDMMALTLHEASPGHHMQISASLLLSLMDFRKYNTYNLHSAPFAFPSYTAYIEGWALYSEALGEEMDLYKDQYELLGRYSGEIYRACRLVVDTGLHALSWTREEAIQYMLNYTSSDRPDIEVEIDRYITWPGQACAYKYGEIKILELRQKAERELGDSFDLKEFHDRILGLASVPLNIVEESIDEMITVVKGGNQNNGYTLNKGSGGLILAAFVLYLVRQ